MRTALIGDSDPEDAYDATDPVPERFDVLERVIAALAERSDPFRLEVRRREALRVLTNLEAEPGVDLIRAGLLRDALESL